MKNHFLLPLFLLVTASLSAQISGIGFRPALTLSKYKLTKEYNDVYDAGYRPGVGIAAFMEINLGNRFTLQPEVAFTQRGINMTSETGVFWDGPKFGYPVSHTVVDYRQKETLNYIDIPLMVERNFGGGNFGGFVAFGPALSFAVGNSRGVEEITVEYYKSDVLQTETDRDEYVIEMGSGRYDDYRNYDFSLNFGGGLTYIMDAGELGLDLRYTMGTRTLNADGLRNRNFQIGISYMYYLNN